MYCIRKLYLFIDWVLVRPEHVLEESLQIDLLADVLDGQRDLVPDVLICILEKVGDEAASNGCHLLWRILRLCILLLQPLGDIGRERGLYRLEWLRRMLSVDKSSVTLATTHYCQWTWVQSFSLSVYTIENHVKDYRMWSSPRHSTYRFFCCKQLTW